MSAEPLLLGVDAGATVTKAALFDLTGGQLAVAAERAPASSPQPRFIERDMEEAWQLCARAIRRCLHEAGVPPAAVAAVGIAGHSDGLYLVDAAGDPVRPAILAPDSRAHEIVASWAASGLREEIAAVIGASPGPGSPAALVAWLLANEPQALASARWLLCCKDWLRLRLTGEVGAEETDAAVLFCDVRTRRYAPALLERLGAGELVDRLPPLHRSTDVVGGVSAEAAAITGLPAGTPVVAGAHDIHAGAIGVGAVADGMLSIIAGTWSINQVSTPQLRIDPRWQERPFVLPDRWLHVGASPASASALEWFVRELGPAGNGRFAQVDAEVEAALEQPSGVLFHPFLLGSPHGTEASGALLGLRGWHTRGQLLRALFEGVVCNHRTHVQWLREGFELRGAARLTGGGARSEVWAQMFADALGVEIEVPDVEEAGARGAAVLAGLGVGLWPDLHAACAATVRLRRRHLPTPQGRARMDEVFDRYVRAREALAPLWPQLR